jgi:CHAT domain-containing protein
MRWTVTFGFICLLFYPPHYSCAQENRAAQGRVAPNSEVALDLAKFVNDYFDLYARGEVDAVLTLWSQNSAELADRRKILEKTRPKSPGANVSDITVQLLGIREGVTDLRVRFKGTLPGEESSTWPGKVGPNVRHVSCVREEKGWKIVRDSDAYRELADALIAAKDVSERNLLFDSNKELAVPDLVVSLVDAIQALESHGDYEKGLAAALVTREFAESIADVGGRGRAILEIGYIQQVLGKYEDALEQYREASEIASKIQDKWLAAASLGSTGIVYRRQGKLIEALDAEKQSLQKFQEVGDEKKICYRLSDIGMTFLRLANYEEAGNYLRRSLELFEQRQDQEGIGFVVQNLAILSDVRGDRIQALQYYMKALFLAQQSDNGPSEAGILNNIGNLYQSENNFSLAEDYYRRSLNLVMKSGEKPGIAYTLQNLGALATRKENWQQALEFYAKAKNLFTEMQDKPGLSDCFASVGNIYAKRDQYEAALRQYQESLKINEEVGNRERIAESLTEVAEAYNAMGKPSEALASSGRACSIAREMKDRENIADCAASMGESYRLLEQPSKARQAFSEAIEAIESLRGDIAGSAQVEQGFLDFQKTFSYRGMVRVLVNERDLRGAFLYAEKTKARVLADVLASGHVKVSKYLTPSERQTEQALEARIVSINTQIEQATSENQSTVFKSQLARTRLELEDFQGKIYSQHPELRTQRGYVKPIEAQEASSLFQDESLAILEFVLNEDDCLVLVLTGNPQGQTDPSLTSYWIHAGARELNARAEKFRQEVGNRQLAFSKSARALYNLLLGPAEKQLEAKKHLLIVPDGGLWNLPFQALQDRYHRYLLEKYSIAYAPSLTAVREMIRLRASRKARDKNTATLLAMGNPFLQGPVRTQFEGVFRDNKLTPLPEAGREVRALARLYGSPPSQMYVGKQASEDRFKAEAGNFKILHLATHGFLDNANPMYSNIALSSLDGRGEDGLLEAREVLNMDLKADLVVLSACETARGRVGGGEGMVGLTWAFFVAGVPTTVASQWKVESRSTTELMLAFHQSLRKMSVDRSGNQFAVPRSMQQAAMKLLHNPLYSHPFYWAGFVVVGDPM